MGGRTPVLLALGALAAGACSSVTGIAPQDTVAADNIEARIGAGVVFLTMTFTPDASMDALFEGPVTADENGCLRLVSADLHTVVWPHGHSFEQVGGTIRILDASGDLVGRVGETFRLPGGEVESLHDGLGFTQADRDLAESHCPGRYWIVAPE
ncbi:MAG TPA: hypothetical protein VMM12_11105 [Longimicrobiales bacterium]|nr:hypothetical protein [Longimicrobiales bacterium]